MFILSFNIGLQIITVPLYIPQSRKSALRSQTSFCLPWLIFQQKLDVLSADCVSPQCPIDARKVLSENVVVIGGTAMLPGFLHRLLAEIRLLVEKPKYSGVLASKSFRIHAPPAKPNCTAWLGGQRGGGVRGLNWQKKKIEISPTYHFIF